MLEQFTFCGWDIACLVLIIGITAAFILLYRRNRDKQRQLKEQLINNYLKDTIDEGRV